MSDSGLFENEVKSVEQFSDDECDIFIQVLEEGSEWDEYFNESENDPLPDWLPEMAKQWKTEWLYEVEYDGPESYRKSLIYNPDTGKAWVYAVGMDNSCLMLEASLEPGEPTPEQVWPFVYQEMLDDGQSYLYGVLSCNSDLIPRAQIEDFLKTQLQEAGMERLEANQGPTIEEWAENIYVKKHTP